MTELAVASPTELQGDVHRLGGIVELDGRVSWVPPEDRGFEPINCYLVRDGGAALLIDTGVTVHRHAVIDQIRALCGDEPRISILLTRFEPDCLINLNAINGALHVERVYGGGVSNPFDFFDDVSTDQHIRAAHSIQLQRRRPGDAITIRPGRQVELLATSLRLLTTFWAYDAHSKALFTSDTFGYLSLEHPDAAPVVDTGSAPVDVARLRRHLLTKLEWLAGADTAPLRRDLLRLFASHDVELICPSHGAVLAGRDTVRRHVDAMASILDEVGASPR